MSIPLRPRRLTSFLAVVWTIHAAPAFAQDAPDFGKLAEFIRWGGVAASVPIVLAALFLMRLVENAGERLSARFSNRRPTIQKVQTVARFALYIIAFGLIDQPEHPPRPDGADGHRRRAGVRGGLRAARPGGLVHRRHHHHVRPAVPGGRPRRLRRRVRRHHPDRPAQRAHEHARPQHHHHPQQQGLHRRHLERQLRRARDAGGDGLLHRRRSGRGAAPSRSSARRASPAPTCSSASPSRCWPSR